MSKLESLARKLIKLAFDHVSIQFGSANLPLALVLMSCSIRSGYLVSRCATSKLHSPMARPRPAPKLWQLLLSIDWPFWFIFVSDHLCGLVLAMEDDWADLRWLLLRKKRELSIGIATLWIIPTKLLHFFSIKLSFYKELLLATLISVQSHVVGSFEYKATFTWELRQRSLERVFSERLGVFKSLSLWLNSRSIGQ